MSSNARIFFAGVGTSFIILAVGFAGGLIMARSALNEPAAYQTQASRQSLVPARVILPTSAEAAQPSPPATPAEPPPSQAQVQSSAEQTPAELSSIAKVQLPTEKQIEKADARKTEAEARERRKRYAERRAKKAAAARARQQEQPMREPGIMAFGAGGDEPRPGGGFFGN